MTRHHDQLRDLLVHELCDLFDAEHQLLDALDDLQTAAHDRQLKSAFQDHRNETIEQIVRLEKVFGSLGQETVRCPCIAMRGLIAEADEAMRSEGDRVVTDLALIAAAQRIAHYQIAGYGAARTMARMLDLDRSVIALQTTLDEEGATDQKLTGLAQTLYQQVA